MRRDLLDLASELARRGEPFAIATVVNREPPLSAQVGDSALITAAGGFHGWVGGSCTRPTVIVEAAKALAGGQPRLIALNPEGEERRRQGVAVFPMTCHSGGSVEIYIEPVLPAPRLLVFGVSPTARALIRLGKAMGYTVVAVDPDSGAADLPEADVVLNDLLAPGLGREWPGSLVFAVVATQGLWDEDAVVAALSREVDYLGVVASPKRFAAMQELLAARLPAGALQAVRNPAGLDLGASRPEEVALSILAEIVQRRHAMARPQAVLPPPEEARDPVCGMTVAVAAARQRATHAGKDYYFCCAGCRERFLAAPERYLVAVGGEA